MAGGSRLSVVQLVPELDSGGVERGTVEIAQALVERDHRSTVVSAGGRLVEALAAGGSRHVAWPIGRKSPLVLLLVPRLRRLFAEVGADVVHARSRLPAWLAHLALRRMAPEMRPRFVTTVHGLYSVGPYSAIMARGERVVAVSETARDYVLEHYPWVEERRVRVIQRGVDPREFPYGHRPDADWVARWYAEFPELEGKRVLTLPGRLTRLKGHHAFFRLLAAAAGRAPVHGLVVGGPTRGRERYARELERTARARRLPVTFAGHRGDMRDVYAVSDIVLSLSAHPESFGRTVLEALSLGVPVVGFDHGGVGELLRSLFPAGRVPLGDEAALLETTLAMLERPQRPAPLRGFTRERMVEETLALYEEVAGARRP